MNERILEIAKQAGLKFPSETDLSPQEKKFAELIARRCMDIASSEALKIAEIDDGRDTFAASIATAGKIGLEFDLFGVEE